jgi:hypothetical protein
MAALIYWQKFNNFKGKKKLEERGNSMISFKQYLRESWRPRSLIGGQSFEFEVRRDPEWCRGITEPLRVVSEFVDLNYHPIRCLSPLLTFEVGVSLQGCGQLESLEGTFLSGVNAGRSGIRYVNASVTGGIDTSALCVSECKRLESIETAYVAGGVDVSNSSVSDISKLKVLSENRLGNALFAAGCDDLKVISGNYVGAVVVSGEGPKSLKNLTIQSYTMSDGLALTLRCDVGEVENFKYKGEINADPEVIKKIHQLMGQEKAGGKGEFDDLF